MRTLMVLSYMGGPTASSWVCDGGGSRDRSFWFVSVYISQLSLINLEFLRFGKNHELLKIFW